MPQAPSHPPPYSIECSSFPPPIQAAAGSQAWAFQRAFESAREPVRWAILTTMRCWKNEWTYKGTDVPRQSIQHAYDIAPHDLKITLDYIVENKVPFYMKEDSDRRCYHLYRIGRMQEVETAMLSQEDFVRKYDEAMELVKEAIVETFESWTLIEDHRPIPPVAINELEAADAYASASGPLKVAASWLLETGYPICVWNKLAFEQAKVAVRGRSMGHTTAHIELHAKNRLRGMY